MTPKKRTKWFLDTEFSEDGKTIDLISLAVVSDDGREYYWESEEFAHGRCNDWVKANVLPHLRGGSFATSRSVIASELAHAVLENDEQPEFWAYYADYDWVALCQLFGTMMDLPTGFPMYCRDLKQLMDERGVAKTQLPAQAGTEHNALNDARWNRDAYHRIAALTDTTPKGPSDD
jgi:hypothetical protein